MNVSLTPELETLVQQKVQSGLYASASEVVREALRLLNDRDTIQQQRMAELRREIRVGLDQLDRGEGIAGEQIFAELKLRSERKAMQEHETEAIPELGAGQSLAEALQGLIGVLDSSKKNGGQVSHVAENASEEFTNILVEKRKAGHL